MKFTKAPSVGYDSVGGRIRPERWLVVAHEATNSGAPRMLLEVLRSMRLSRGSAWECDIILRRGGPLVRELASYGRVRRLSHPWAEGNGLLARLLRRTLAPPRAIPGRFARWVETWEAKGGGLIFSNTGTNGELLAEISRKRSPVISYVHETEYSLRRFNRPEELAATLTGTDRFLAVSHAVREDLRGLGVPAEKIQLLPNFLPAMPSVPDRRAARSAVCRRLQLPPDTRLIIGCGHIDRLKGTDLFVEMAQLAGREVGAGLAFVWVGGDVDLEFAREMRAAAAGAVKFTGAVDDPGLYFAASELVTVTSRIESFSRVVLEAGALGRPVLAYASARGPADLLEDKALVRADTAPAMGEAVLRLLRSPGEAEQLGAALRARIEGTFLRQHWLGVLSGLSGSANGSDDGRCHPQAGTIPV